MHSVAIFPKLKSDLNCGRKRSFIRALECEQNPAMKGPAKLALRDMGAQMLQ
jgi:hypothetical protein